MTHGDIIRIGAARVPLPLAQKWVADYTDVTSTSREQLATPSRPTTALTVALGIRPC